MLLSPPRQGIGLWVWLAPGIALAAGLLAVLATVRRWTRRARALSASAAGDPEALARARAELAAHDERGARA